MHFLRRAVTTGRLTAPLGQCLRRFVSTTNQTSSALTAPLPEDADAPANPKLLSIVQQISQLNLLEVSELSALLKKTLNLPDAPMVSYGAPVSAAPADDDDEQSAAPAVIQTAFKVKLTGFDESKKIVLIKAIKGLCEGTNLVQAKKMLDTLPAFLKEDISRDEANELKAKIEESGAIAEVV